MRHLILPLLLAGPVWADDIAADVQAAPRLPETSQAAIRINLRLAALDAMAQATIDACSDLPEHDFARSISVTLDTPAYLSLVISEGGFCTGAAHPWWSTYSLTFDRGSGDLVAPLTWLPAALSPGPAPVHWTAEDELARHAPLTRLYLSRLAPDSDPLVDCPLALQTVPHSFDLWPNAATHSLMLLPSGLPYLDSLCAVPVALPLSDLQALHFSPRLIAALSPP